MFGSKPVRSNEKTAQQSFPEDPVDNALDPAKNAGQAAGDSADIPSSFLHLSLFPLGRNFVHPSQRHAPRSPKGTLTQTVEQPLTMNLLAKIGLIHKLSGLIPMSSGLIL